MRRRRLASYLRAILLWVAAVFVAGCGRPPLTFESKELHCVPLQDTEGWRVDVFIKGALTNPGRTAAEFAPSLLRLRTTRGDLPASTSPPARLSPGLMLDPTQRYDSLERLGARTLAPLEAVNGWLRFDGVLRLGAVVNDQPGRETARRRLFEDLAALQPELAAAGDDLRITLGLAQFRTLPDPLPTRPSAYCDAITVIDLPDGLCGFQYSRLEERLRARGCAADERVVVLVGEGIDPCLGDWWPPTQGQVGPARLAVALAPWPPTDWGQMGVGCDLRLMTRAVPKSGHLGFPSEPTAVADLLRESERQVVFDDWLQRDDSSAILAALRNIDGVAAHLADVVRLLREGSSVEVRVAACHALGRYRLGDLGSLRPTACSALAAAAATHDGWLSDLAMNTACDLGCPKAVLRAAMDILERINGNSAAYRVLVACGDSGAVRLLMAKLADGWNEDAAAALVAIGAPWTLAEARQRLAKDLVANYQLLPLLAGLGTATDGAWLADRWSRDLPPHVQESLLEAMSELGGEAAFQRLLEVARHYSDYNSVRIAAVIGLRPFLDARAVPIWEELAPGLACRDHCIEALSVQGVPEAKAALRRLAQSPDEYVRRRSRKALGW